MDIVDIILINYRFLYPRIKDLKYAWINVRVQWRLSRFLLQRIQYLGLEKCIKWRNVSSRIEAMGWLNVGYGIVTPQGWINVSYRI